MLVHSVGLGSYMWRRLTFKLNYALSRTDRAVQPLVRLIGTLRTAVSNLNALTLISISSHKHTVLSIVPHQVTVCLSKHLCLIHCTAIYYLKSIIIISALVDD